MWSTFSLKVLTLQTLKRQLYDPFPALAAWCHCPDLTHPHYHFEIRGSSYGLRPSLLRVDVRKRSCYSRPSRSAP